ncbi:MAG: glycosyltransferase family 1 protein [Lachnospiraceae bacterium]|nr:glycosyltransferase family 1 protein [Lachnospiraceae bacterium]
MKTYILIDKPQELEDMSFIASKIEGDYEIVYPDKRCNSFKQQVLACKECIKRSSSDDIIVCWYDFMGVICWWLCKILQKKRNIIALNILLKSKKTMKNRLAKYLYRKAITASDFLATVTSKEYGKWINNVLGIEVTYVLLRDVYHSNIRKMAKTNNISNSVFCGGRNGRDWGTFFKLANEMPEVTFNCILSKDEYEIQKQHFGNNVNAKYDVQEEEFLNFMCQSDMVVMPLNTEAPAGLIVLFQAAANGLLNITSDTVTTRAYFTPDRGVLCGTSVDEWTEKIRYYLEHKEERLKKAKAFQEYLENQCNEEEYAKIVASLVNKILREEK